MITIALPLFRRLHRILLLSCGLTCSSLFAQTAIPYPPQLPEFVAAKNTNGWNSSQDSQPEGKERTEKIAAYFQKWEDALNNLKQLECSVKITTVDKDFNEKEDQIGTYRFLKIKEQAETKLYRNLNLDSNKKSLEKNIKIINDKFYLITRQSKYISILNIGDLLHPEKRDTKYTFKSSWHFLSIDDFFIVVVLTFKPTQIPSRYLVKLAKEDDYYLYFDLYPKSQEDKSLFSRGRLVLLKSTFLPRQVWCAQPNNTEELYEFTEMKLDPALKVSDFAALEMENFKGWTIQDSTRRR